MSERDLTWWLAQGEGDIDLLPGLANRHGLIAGATGTGKTVSLRVLAEAFSDAGFLVDRAGDGEEALARIEGGHYDLVVSDLKMPRMDGIQLFGALREQHPAMVGRIMFVTGDVVGTDAERFLADSGCRWLAKPFRLGELLRIAKEVMR